MRDRDPGEKLLDRLEKGPARRRWPLAILDPQPFTAMPRGCGAALRKPPPSAFSSSCSWVRRPRRGADAGDGDRAVAHGGRGVLRADHGAAAPVVDWISKAPDIGRSIHDKLAVLWGRWARFCRCRS